MAMATLPLMAPVTDGVNEVLNVQLACELDRQGGGAGMFTGDAGDPKLDL